LTRTRPRSAVSEAVHLAGHQDDAVTRQHVPGARERAKPGREVQCAAAKPVLCLHRFSRLEPDPHAHRQRGVLPDRVGEALLQGDGRAKRLAGRVEHAKRLVTAQLDCPSAPGADDLSRQLGEARGQPRGLLVASLARERRVPADVRDQKGANRRRAGYTVQLSQEAILVRARFRLESNTMLRLLFEVIPADEEGKRIVIAMLIVGLIFISVIAIGQTFKYFGHRRQDRKARQPQY
jgi:hypothetical protein